MLCKNCCWLLLKYFIVFSLLCVFPTHLAPLPDGTIKFRLLFEKDLVLNMAANLDDLAAVGQLQLNEQEIQGNVEREIKKLKFYISQISSFVADEDYEKLKRLLEVTVPGKLNAIENLIEQMTETMIDADKREEDVTSWITRTRRSFAGCNEQIRAATATLQQYLDSVEQHRRRLQENMGQQEEAELQRRLNERRREQEEYESRLLLDREEREHKVLMARIKIQLETKEKELEMEKATKSTRAKLPKLTIPKFKGTSTDWIRFKSMFTSQIESQPISNVDKFSYLMELIGEKPMEIIGNIPMNNDGYIRAWELLQEEYGREQSVIAAHTSEILKLPVIIWYKIF